LYTVSRAAAKAAAASAPNHTIREDSPVVTLSGSVGWVGSVGFSCVGVDSSGWVGVGDRWEKGQDSLALLRHLMELPRTHTVYPLCGNCDGLVHRFFETDELDEHFFSVYLPQHPESTLRQMAREGGFEQLEDLPRLREDLRRAFPRGRTWPA